MIFQLTGNSRGGTAIACVCLCLCACVCVKLLCQVQREVKLKFEDGGNRRTPSVLTRQPLLSVGNCCRESLKGKSTTFLQFHETEQPFDVEHRLTGCLMWSSRHPYKIKELQLHTVLLWKGHKLKTSDWIFLINYISLNVNFHVRFQLFVSFWCKPPNTEWNCVHNINISLYSLQNTRSWSQSRLRLQHSCEND